MLTRMPTQLPDSVSPVEIRRLKFLSTSNASTPQLFTRSWDVGITPNYSSDSARCRALFVEMSHVEGTCWPDPRTAKHPKPGKQGTWKPMASCGRRGPDCRASSRTRSCDPTRSKPKSTEHREKEGPLNPKPCKLQNQKGSITSDHRSSSAGAERASIS